MRRQGAEAFGLLLVLLAAAGTALASESTLDDEPAPGSAAELEGALGEAFEEEPPSPALFPRLSGRLKGLPPFLRDSQLRLHLRSYVFNRRQRDDARSAAWTYGGWLAYESGWWKETFSLGATLYTSQRIYGPSDKGGTLLLRPGQRSYTVLGQAYGRLRYADHTLTLYRQELDLPFVNRQDNRMTPNTFEGVTLFKESSELRYGAGFLTQMKRRNDDEFISMSEAAGVPGTSSKGLAFAGFRYSPGESFQIGAVDYLVKDVLNILYAEVDLYRALAPDLDLRLDAQLSDQRSVGDDLLTGRSFDTRNFGARVALGYRDAILTAAFSTTDKEEAIRKPYGSYPGYLSLMVEDFDRAGEDAWGVGLSYRFARLGLPHLSAFTNFARGTGAREPGSGASLPDRWEWDLTVDYRIETGPMRGFWLRLRGALVDEEHAPKRSKEFRLIFNYELPVL